MTPAFLRSTIVLIAAGGIGLLSAPAGAFDQERECSVPESFYAYEPPLTTTAKALAGRREVVIAALGGASPLGLAAGGAGFAWPARLASALAGRISPAAAKGVDLAVAPPTPARAADRSDRRLP